ncbi:MAG: MFS transporter [Chloroflexi bacterium]|nr:MAG: MFS transporter [Chloroflexota bacterium]
MAARVPAPRRAIPFPPARLLPALGASAALDGITGLVVLSAGNTYLLRTLGAAAVLPAIALTLQAAMKVAASPLAGWVADRRRLSAVLPTVPVLATAGLVTMLLTRSVIGYLVGLALLSTGISIAWVLLRHCVGNVTTEVERGRAATWVSLASGGAVASGFGAGTLLGGVEPRAAFVLALVLVAAAAVLLNLVRRTSDRSSAIVTAETRGTSAPARRFESATLGLVAAGQFVLSGGLLVTFWPFVLRDLDIEVLRVPWLLAPAGVITLGMLAGVARWSQPGRRLAEIGVLYVFVATGFALAALTHSALAFALAIAAAVPALVAAIPVVTAVVIDFSRGRSGPAGALGWLGSAEAAGSLTGAALTGVIIASTDARGAFVALAITAALLACATGASLRASRR